MKEDEREGERRRTLTVTYRRVLPIVGRLFVHHRPDVVALVEWQAGPGVRGGVPAEVARKQLLLLLLLALTLLMLLFLEWRCEGAGDSRD